MKYSVTFNINIIWKRIHNVQWWGFVNSQLLCSILFCLWKLYCILFENLENFSHNIWYITFSYETKNKNETILISSTEGRDFSSVKPLSPRNSIQFALSSPKCIVIIESKNKMLQWPCRFYRRNTWEFKQEGLVRTNCFIFLAIVFPNFEEMCLLKCCRNNGGFHLVSAVIVDALYLKCQAEGFSKN